MYDNYSNDVENEDDDYGADNADGADGEDDDADNDDNEGNDNDDNDDKITVFAKLRHKLLYIFKKLMYTCLVQLLD
nr:coiled-coil domain-containing protein 1-like [Nomia melanderi]